MLVVLSVALVVATLLPSAPLCPVSGHSNQRFEKPAAKGVELYSWKARSGSYRFSLLWGTNRNKTDSEIKSPQCTLADVPTTKAALSLLAKGEHVFWSNAVCPKKDCAYPPDEVVEDLRAHAERIGVSLERK